MPSGVPGVVRIVRNRVVRKEFMKRMELSGALCITEYGLTDWARRFTRRSMRSSSGQHCVANRHPDPI